MPLRLLNIKPGFNKQFTASGAEGQWIDGDFVRFRYGLPEKIGGWETLTSINSLERSVLNTSGQILITEDMQR
jgi:hypothetical protein